MKNKKIGVIAILIMIGGLVIGFIQKFKKKSDY